MSDRSRVVARSRVEPCYNRGEVLEHRFDLDLAAAEPMVSADR